MKTEVKSEVDSLDDVELASLAQSTGPGVHTGQRTSIKYEEVKKEGPHAAMITSGLNSGMIMWQLDIMSLISCHQTL